MLPQLLGKFNEVPLRVVLLRRMLLRLRFAPHWLDPIGRILARTPWIDAWYQFAYGYCYWRGVKKTLTPRPLWDRLTYSMPILMYHAVGAPGEPASRYVIPARRFARHMAWLKWRRYRVISLEEYLRCRWAHRLPPARSVVLTFDDGYADNLTLAYPVLRRCRFPATLFIVSSAVGQTNQWDQGSVLTGRPLLSWRGIRKLWANGLSMGAHTQTHASLAGLAPAQIEQEIAGSRQVLEQMLGIPVRTFAYPYGVWTPESRAILARTGFLGACGIEPGKNSPITPLYGLRRVEMYGTDSLFQLELGLTLGAIPRDR
jgi:peptidoglycan/xylan/chitin deacetylase (PgdA/CDA1 family)